MIRLHFNPSLVLVYVSTEALKRYANECMNAVTIRVLLAMPSHAFVLSVENHTHVA